MSGQYMYNPTNDIGRPIVPVQDIAEALGYKVSFDTNTITISDNNTTVAVQQAATVNNAITVTINNVPVPMDVAPVVENGRTLVPLRAIFEALGAEVDWQQSTQTVTAVRGDMTVSLTIGSNVLIRNADRIVLDVPAKIVDGRTLVPVRAVSEAFGAAVDWDPSTRTVKITE